ncbi:DUF962 domain-containing protein [Acidovorax sp. SUPP2539]|uniref:DUF962 domain-containing protein n=1 Tax=Acidovorax sp. SUPP2539 TaxID=2920878 RepID=UPI0023DE5F69|nr:DUF962 domain-containing protein [Acidovorax sp. SUPP2539]GKS91728.1 DUF962 domain-containing protein [Acidovorax sp. SUPP2539]
MSSQPPYRTFREFYSFYLSEHANPVSRRLHFLGSSMALILLTAALWQQNGGLLGLALLQGYAFAWVGHFFFEHNRLATFRYPLMSFMGDWCMWWQILTGRIRF